MIYVFQIFFDGATITHYDVSVCKYSIFDFCDISGPGNLA